MLTVFSAILGKNYVGGWCDFLLPLMGDRKIRFIYVDCIPHSNSEGTVHVEEPPTFTLK